MPDSHGAEPEHNMYESLVLFIRMNYEEVIKIARSFLRQKGLTLDNYLEYIEKPGNRGNELSFHLLAMMQGIHYCIITKNNVYYSMPNAMPSPSAVHMTLRYLGNKVFRDTMVSKEGPPKSNLSKKCLYLLAHSPHQHQGRNGRENEMRGKQQKPQMPRNLWIQKCMCVPMNCMMSLKRKKKINPLPVQKNIRKRLEF